jgi:hypothetical protein
VASQENPAIAESSSSGYASSTSLVAGGVLVAVAVASGGPLCLAQEPAPRLAAGPHIAPDWEHIQTASGGTRATLKVSKDNGIFGFKVSEFQGFKVKTHGHWIFLETLKP